MLSATQTGNQIAKDTAAIHVLVVDDEPYFCACLQSSLQAAGHVVYTATDGQDALNVFREVSIDLVLTDLQMPNMDGYTLCAQLRTFSNVPIIILSSFSAPADLLLGFRAGANEYLTKPFQLHEVEARIQRLLQRARL